VSFAGHVRRLPVKEEGLSRWAWPFLAPGALAMYLPASVSGQDDGARDIVSSMTGPCRRPGHIFIFEQSVADGRARPGDGGMTEVRCLKSEIPQSVSDTPPSLAAACCWRSLQISENWVMGAVCNYRPCFFCSGQTLQRFHSGINWTIGAQVTEAHYKCLECNGTNYLTDEETEAYRLGLDPDGTKLDDDG